MQARLVIWPTVTKQYAHKYAISSMTLAVTIAIIVIFLAIL